MKKYIQLKNLDLHYPLLQIYDRKLSTFFTRKKGRTNIIKALNNICININENERIGLIGNNGSGKTTLLKVLAEILPPTNGSYLKNGNIASLLDLNCGFEKDATGYENIFLVSYSKGISKENAEKNIKFIEEFSGLKDKLKFPVRTFSTGMISRLSTSILLSQKPDIFITDEFFATGDNEYLLKLEQNIKQLLSETKIFIFASHNHDLLKKLCNRFIKLENGIVTSDTKDFPD